MKTILNDRTFNARAVDVVEPVESEDLPRLEGEGGSGAPKPTAVWIDVPLGHGLWRRPHRAVDETKSGKAVNKKDENE